MSAVSVTKPVDRFEHPALFYRDQRDYLAGVMRFINDGLAAGEPVMVAVPTRHLDRLRAALGREPVANGSTVPTSAVPGPTGTGPTGTGPSETGPSGTDSGGSERMRIGSGPGSVELHDMAVAGRNPGRIIGDLLLTFADRHPGRRVRIVGEPIWAGRDAIEYPACAQHEALVNAAFEGADAIILCPYHVSGLPPHIIADAKRTHPALWTTGERRASADFDGGYAAASLFNLPLPPAPARAPAIGITATNSNETRRFTASYALSVGLSIDRVADAVLAVDELVSNTIGHAGGIGRLRAWTGGGRAVFEVSDGGFIDDPLAGRRPVPPEQIAGRGLMIVHRLSDLVRVHTTPGATAIRSYFELGSG